MPCIKFRAVNVLQSNHSWAVTWRRRYFSTSKTPSERRQCCSDGTFFGGAAVDTENCRPRAVGGGGGCPLFNGDFWKSWGNFVHLQRNFLPPKKVKKLKINRIEIVWIYAHIFGYKKWNWFFIAEYPKHSQLVQNLHTTNLWEKKRKKLYRSVLQWVLAKKMFTYKFNFYIVSKERETKNLQPELSHRIHSCPRQHVNFLIKALRQWCPSQLLLLVHFLKCHKPKTCDRLRTHYAIDLAP